MRTEPTFTELIEKAKAVKIESYLSQKGIQPDSRTNNKLWYKSPLRQKERTASFKVNANRNVWFDWGTHKKGDIIDLCMILEMVSFRDAVLRLNNGAFDTFSFFGGNIYPPKKKEENTFQLLKTKSLENEALISYLNRRKINRKIASKYLLEAYFKNTQTGKRYFSVGVENEKHGFAMRNELMKSVISPACYTLIPRIGSSDLMVFEGFIDALSFLVWRKYQEFRTNVIILNSTSNIGSVIDVLSDYQKIYTFLDNDDTGQEAATTICGVHSQAENWSIKLFPQYNDFNDFICNKLA